MKMTEWEKQMYGSGAIDFAMLKTVSEAHKLSGLVVPVISNTVGDIARHIREEEEARWKKSMYGALPDTFSTQYGLPKFLKNGAGTVGSALAAIERPDKCCIQECGGLHIGAAHASKKKINGLGVSRVISHVIFFFT